MVDKENAVKTLQEIVSHYSEKIDGKVAVYEKVADTLKAADGKALWGWRYIQGVATTKQAPSGRLCKAIEVVAASLDHLPISIAKAIRVGVYAEPGTIAENSYVLGVSRLCATPGCVIEFVPNVPWRKKCHECSPVK